MKYETKALVTEASQIKNFIEKNKKIPKAATLTTGETLSPYSIAYLLSLAVKDNLKTKSYDLVNVIIYNPAKKHVDTINNKDVSKKDYMIMIDNFIKFCRKYHRVPRYITVPSLDIKVSFELYLYCISKIVVFIDKNKKLPNYCNFNKGFKPNAQSNNKTSKNNSSQSIASCQNKINSNKGCDAMGQNTPYYCGVSALQKCLYKFGIQETQKTLAKICGTTTSGTSHQGLHTGIAYASKKHNVKLTVTEKYFSDYTLKQLKQLVCNKDKAIICHNLYRNKYGHYEAWKNVNVDKKEIEVINSLGDKCALGCYCGYIEHRSYNTQKSYCNGISQKSLIIITKG